MNQPKEQKKKEKKLKAEEDQDLMKPIPLKTGIPLALSFVGFILSLIKLHCKNSSSQRGQQENSLETHSEEDQQSFNGIHSTSSSFKQEEEKEEKEEHITHTHIMNSLVSLHIQDRPRLEKEILGLKEIVTLLQNRELELKTKFIQYCGLKEQELIISQIENKLELELVRVELLDTKVEFMEAESRRFEAMIFEYLRSLEQLQYAKMENGLLKMKVKKLSKNTRKRARLFHQQASTLRLKDAEISRTHQELENKENLIKGLKDEIAKMKQILDHLEKEKKDLEERVKLAENSASLTSKVEEEISVIDNHQDELLIELDQLRNVRVAEAEELIYLRWINACLRHELTKNQEQERHEKEDKENQLLELGVAEKCEENENNLDYESDNISVGTKLGEFCTTRRDTNQRKPKLLNKFRKWVKGNEKCKTSRLCDEEEEYQNKCFGRRSVSDEPSERLVDGRKSYSSV